MRPDLLAAADGLGLRPGAVQAMLSLVGQREPYSLLSAGNIATSLNLRHEETVNGLMLLLLYHHIKATFRPRHRQCDYVLGSNAGSADDLIERYAQGEFGTICGHCGRELEPEDLVVEIVFWSLGEVDDGP